MRILITGTSGQVGWEFKRELSIHGDLLCPARSELDLGNSAQVRDAITDHSIDLVVNCAAYTAVDLAETETESAGLINHRGPSELARACKQTGATLVHLSTDYVLGDMGNQPMSEEHPATPLGVYGKSKLDGENAVRESGCEYLIFRTSWVYASRGKNFLLTMLRLASQGKPLRIVNDQWGAPTPARLIASSITHCLSRTSLLDSSQTSAALLNNTYNLCTAGFTTWHGFAAEIFRLREELTGRAAPTLESIPTSEFPTPAKRQTNSRLQLDRLHQRFGIKMPGWQDALAPVVAEALSVSPDAS
jgi:dTDP-4-dehydrorhamnose reductase